MSKRTVELKEVVMDETLANAVWAMEKLINKYCGNKPIIEVALKAWHEQTSPEAVFEMASKDKTTFEDLASVRFHSVAANFMIIEALQNMMTDLIQLTKEQDKIKFVINELCKERGIEISK